MDKGNQLIELAERIPIKNINFYLNAYHAMNAVSLQEITDSDDTGLKFEFLRLIRDNGLRSKPRTVLEVTINYCNEDNMRDAAGKIKMLGTLIVTHLRQGEFVDQGVSIDNPPFTFLSYAIAEDLKLYGFGNDASFLENVITDLRGLRSIDPASCSSRTIRTYLKGYSHVDIAAIFLGYSLARQGSLRAIVPIPANAVGFVAVLNSELKKLSPRNLE